MNVMLYASKIILQIKETAHCFSATITIISHNHNTHCISNDEYILLKYALIELFHRGYIISIKNATIISDVIYIENGILM